MCTIQVKDKQFVLSIAKEAIHKEVARVASEINSDLKGKHPLFVSVLNGAFMFTSDLMKLITLPCEVTFVKLSSYEGMESKGNVRVMVGLAEDIAGRDVVIVEDIIDTGLTMQCMVQMLSEQKPASLRIATLLLKPDKLKIDLHIDYVAMRIPNEFIVGYGLDYDGYGRNYPDIYTLATE